MELPRRRGGDKVKDLTQVWYGQLGNSPLVACRLKSWLWQLIKMADLKENHWNVCLIVLKGRIRLIILNQFKDEMRKKL